MNIREKMHNGELYLPTDESILVEQFGYVDRFFRCSFTSLKSDLGVFERNLGLTGKKDYRTGIGFQFKRLQSLAQLQAYLGELERLNIRIEGIFNKWNI